MNKETATLIENFVKVALFEIEDLQHSLDSLRDEKHAKQAADAEELHHVLKQAAQALYDSDFINDEYDKKKFVKRAKEDQKYLATVIQKICQAADVAAFGSVASVKTAGEATDDPVMRKAFGYDANYNLLDS